MIKEEILYHIWQFKHFSFIDLRSTDNEEVVIENSGSRNYNSGPDFSNARIRVNDTLWAGDVEIHVKSSDWYLHNHQNDDNYNKVVLHLVWLDDKKVIRKDGSTIPTIELKGKVSKRVILRYEELLNSSSSIPCQEFIAEVNNVVVKSMLDKVMVERLLDKSSLIQDKFNVAANDLEYLTFYLIGKYLFGTANNLNFEIIFTHKLFQALKKERLDFLSVESILFGVSGFLNEPFLEEYPSLLKDRYTYLKTKHSLTEIEKSIWKFMRMYPSNFPTIRLSQFSNLIYRKDRLFTRIKESSSLEEISKLLNLNASEYWEEHYHFEGKKVQKSKRNLGKSTREIIFINAISPLLYFYGEEIGNQKYKDLSVDYLEKLSAENNKYTRKWSELGIRASSAFDSQALLQLKSNYCDSKKCLNCTIGNYLIKSTKDGK